VIGEPSHSSDEAPAKEPYNNTEVITPPTANAETHVPPDKDTMSQESSTVTSMPPVHKETTGIAKVGQDPPLVVRRSQRNINRPTRFNALMRSTVSVVLSPFVFAHGHILSTHDHMVPMIKMQTVERWDWETEHHTPGVLEPSAQHREYLRLCDEQYDAEHDPIDHRIWQPLRMLSHNVRKRRGSRIVLARVTWLTEEPTWIPLSSLKRDSPFLIIDYVMRKPELMRIPDFHWVCTYVDNAPKLQQVHNVFKATTSERQPKIKFGVEVPYSIHHALQLDQRA
jgi:hypothetical protein